MTKFVFDPEHPETRKLIDEFKSTRLRNIHKLAAHQWFIENPEHAFGAWIEQIGDAELYEQACREGIQRRLEQHDAELGVYDDE